MYSIKTITNYSIKENIHSIEKLIFPQDEHAEAKPWEEELGARRHPDPPSGHLCTHVQGCGCKFPKLGSQMLLTPSL